MNFRLILQSPARETLEALAGQDETKYAKVQKTLGLMQTNLKHPGLHTHKNASRVGPNKEEVFEAYVENRTPGAYRVFWHYGPGQGVLTILSIVPHPNSHS